MAKGQGVLCKDKGKDGSVKYLWKVWANSLGVKAKAEDDVSSDQVAIVRTIILLVYVITNFVIVAGNVRHW